MNDHNSVSPRPDPPAGGVPLLEEGMLRAALRLERDERGPRVDVAAIMAAAASDRATQWAVGSGLLLTALAVSWLGGVVGPAVPALTAAIVDGGVGASIVVAEAFLTGAAVSMPLAILVTAIGAALLVRNGERGTHHHAS